MVHAYCAIVSAVVTESDGGECRKYNWILCRRQTRNVATGAIRKREKKKTDDTNAYSDGLSWAVNKSRNECSVNRATAMAAFATKDSNDGRKKKCQWFCFCIVCALQRIFELVTACTSTSIQSHSARRRPKQIDEILDNCIARAAAIDSLNFHLQLQMPKKYICINVRRELWASAPMWKYRVSNDFRYVIKFQLPLGGWTGCIGAAIDRRYFIQRSVLVLISLSWYRVCVWALSSPPPHILRVDFSLALPAICLSGRGASLPSHLHVFVCLLLIYMHVVSGVAGFVCMFVKFSSDKTLRLASSG